jgi:Fe-S-cluster containining protein
VTLPGLPGGHAAKIDCGGCHACCKRMLVILGDGDDLSRGDWEWKVYGLARVAQMKHKKNGDCINLTKKGCAVYSKRPKICRAFDCEDFVKTRANLRNCGNDPVIREGKRRLKNKEKQHETSS